jgi:hypothetical protein
MKKRSIKRLTICSAALLALILCGFHCVSPFSTSAADACARIQIGMTKKEVRAILGACRNVALTQISDNGVNHDEFFEIWNGDDGTLFLRYSEWNVVVNEFYNASDSPFYSRPTFLDRLRSALGW